MIKRLIERLEGAKRVRDEQGAAFIELALCLPMLFVLMFGVIEFSQLILDNQIMTGLSRQGSNIASREPNMKLQTIVSALGTQGASLNIGTRGRIIITEVDGTSTKPVIESQAISTTGIPATSVTASWIANPRRNIPLNAKTVLKRNPLASIMESADLYRDKSDAASFIIHFNTGNEEFVPWLRSELVPHNQDALRALRGLVADSQQSPSFMVQDKARVKLCKHLIHRGYLIPA